jgi:hypothetical protein
LYRVFVGTITFFWYCYMAATISIALSPKIKEIKECSEHQEFLVKNFYTQSMGIQNRK